MLDQTPSDQSCLFTGVHVLLSVLREVEYPKGSSPPRVAKRSDDWDDENAEDDGHMADLVRVSQTCSKVVLEQWTLSFCWHGSAPLCAHKSLPCLKGGHNTPSDHAASLQSNIPFGFCAGACRYSILSAGKATKACYGCYIRKRGDEFARKSVNSHVNNHGQHLERADISLEVSPSVFTTGFSLCSLSPKIIML